MMALPGFPDIMLNDTDRIKTFLATEFWADDLEVIAPYLWLLSTQSSKNVNPLWRQRVKGREIVITENPRLHLVWIHDRIFIKPLPRYLLSADFWRYVMNNNLSPLGDRRTEIKRAALGYLRTYRHLIRHESDLAIAQQEHLRLVPKDLDWPSFCRFIAAVSAIEDTDVSKRYHHGELRLSRLNFYAPILLRRFYYEQIHGQYADYFARLYAPVLAIFAITTTILNAMQVELALDQVSKSPWTTMWSFIRWFSTLTMFGTILVALCFSALWLWMVLDEWIFALRARLSRRRRRTFQSSAQQVIAP